VATFTSKSGIMEATSGVTGLGRASFLERMKDQYLPKWDDMVNDKTVLLKLIGKKVGTIVGGKKSLTSVMTSYSQSAGIALFEDDELPLPNAPTYDQLTLFPRALYARVRFTGHVERAARAGNVAVFAKPVAEQLRSARRTHEMNKNRMLYLGPYQAMSRIVSVDTSSAGTAANPVITLRPREGRQPGVTGGADTLWDFGAQYLRDGMLLDFVKDSGGIQTAAAPEGNATCRPRIKSIASRNSAAPTITLEFADPTGASVAFQNAPDGDSLIIPFGSRLPSASYVDATGAGDGHETSHAGVNGLFNLITDSNYAAHLYTKTRTAAEYLNGNVSRADAGSPRDPGDELIAKVLDQVSENTHNPGDDPDCIVVSPHTRRKWVSVLTDAKTPRMFSPIIKGRGYGKQSFTAGDTMLPFVQDKDCPPGAMFCIAKGTFGKFVEAPMHMPDGGERFVDGKDSREVVLVESFNMACKAPTANAVIEDLTYDVY